MKIQYGDTCMSANTWFQQILAQTAHCNIFGVIKQNKPELVLRTQNCVESIVTFSQVAVASLDKTCDGSGLVFLPVSVSVLRTKEDYLMIAWRSTGGAYFPFVNGLCHFRDT